MSSNPETVDHISLISRAYLASFCWLLWMQTIDSLVSTLDAMDELVMEVLLRVAHYQKL